MLYSGLNTSQPNQQMTGQQWNGLAGMTFRATNDFLVGMLAGYENRLCLAAAQRSFSRRGMDHGHLPGMEAVAEPALRDRSGLFDPSAQWRRGKRERRFPWLPHDRHRGLDRQLQGHFAVGRSRFSRCWKRSEPISTASGPRKAIATSRPAAPASARNGSIARNGGIYRSFPISACTAITIFRRTTRQQPC